MVTPPQLITQKVVLTYPLKRSKNKSIPKTICQESKEKLYDQIITLQWPLEASLLWYMIYIAASVSEADLRCVEGTHPSPFRV